MGGLKPSRSSTRSTDQQLIHCVQKHLPPMSNLLLGGTTFTPPSLMAFLQSRIEAADRVENAKRTLQIAIETYEIVDHRTRTIVRDLRRHAIHVFGESSEKLADFGITPKRGGGP